MQKKKSIVEVLIVVVIVLILKSCALKFACTFFYRNIKGFMVQTGDPTGRVKRFTVIAHTYQ